MKRPVIVCGFILVTASRAGVIEGSRQVGVDKSAILRVPMTSAGSNYSWQVAGEVAWVSGENKTETFVILLDLAAGQHIVSFVSFDRAVHEVAIVEAGSPPGPTPPPPTPNPPAPLPDGRFKLSNSTAIWVTSLVPMSARSRASSLAASFRANASAIAAGTLAEAEQILAETKKSNNLALGSTEMIAAWKPFGATLEKELARLHAADELRVASDYKDAWLEIALGLEAVK